jgi:GAF domain-containing protein
VGAVALEKWQANFYTPEQVQIAMTFAGQAAVAFENARLYEESLNRAAELDQRSQRLALLNRFSSQLSGLLDAGEIQKVTAEELRQAFGALRISVVSLEGQTPTWVFAMPDVELNYLKHYPIRPLFDRLQRVARRIHKRRFPG